MQRVSFPAVSKFRFPDRRVAITQSRTQAVRRSKRGAAYGRTCASSSTRSWAMDRKREPSMAENLDAPTSIKGYLDALRTRLKGQPPGLIQDALADAEEYLRAEQAQAPDETEAQVLSRVIE